MNQRLGLFCVMVTTTVAISNQSTVAYLFLQNPGMTMFQLLFVRSVFSCIITSIILRGELKREMYDNVSSDDMKKVFIRVCIFATSMPLMVLGLKYFPPSMARAAMGLQPIWAGLIGYLLLNEHVTKQDIASIATSLFAVFLITKQQLQADFSEMRT
jgi:drug/metabolite transporter (DMT)-like permease